MKVPTPKELLQVATSYSNKERIIFVVALVILSTPHLAVLIAGVSSLAIVLYFMYDYFKKVSAFID